MAKQKAKAKAGRPAEGLTHPLFVRLGAELHLALTTMAAAETQLRGERVPVSSVVRRILAREVLRG